MNLELAKLGAEGVVLLAELAQLCDGVVHAEGEGGLQPGHGLVELRGGGVVGSAGAGAKIRSTFSHLFDVCLPPRTVAGLGFCVPALRGPELVRGAVGE